MKTCTPEEGVAIFFAEDMRERLLPHVGRAFLDSPVGLRTSCHEVLNAFMQLPDGALYHIRKELSSLGTITDPARFTGMTARSLTQEEAAQ